MRYITLNCVSLHYITLHCTTLHYSTLHYSTLHYSKLHCSQLHCKSHHFSAVLLASWVVIGAISAPPSQTIQGVNLPICVHCAVHYADLGDVQQGKPRPGKASLWMKNACSSTGHKICSSAYTMLPKTSTILVQELEPEVTSEPISGIFVQINEQILWLP